jgi:hypothetical protein
LIVVIGSAYDRVAASMVASWPSARLVSVGDLLSPGWSWLSDETTGRWVVDGRCVSDDEITGIFLRRSNVYAEELLSIHPDDRAYAAGEAHAFLIAVLASTRARVVNPVTDAALGDDAVRPERWMNMAGDAGLRVNPIRLTDRARRPPRSRHVRVEVVAGKSFGDAPDRCRAGAVELARMLGLQWAVCIFDGRHRLLSVSTAAAPREDASRALGQLLTGNVA